MVQKHISMEKGLGVKFSLAKHCAKTCLGVDCLVKSKTRLGVVLKKLLGCTMAYFMTGPRGMLQGKIKMQILTLLWVYLKYFYLSV